MATTSTTASVNHAPETTPLTINSTENAGVVGINLLEGAIDRDGNTLSVASLALASGPKASFSVRNGVLSLNTAQFNKLKTGESATLTFTYMVSDGKLKTPQVMTLVIEGANDAPVVKSALKMTTTEESAPLTVDLIAGATDVDGDVLSVAGLTQSSGPAAMFTVDNGKLALDPTQFNSLKYGQNAVLTFTYMVSDGTAMVPQTLTVTVAGRNDAPVVAGAVIAATNEDAGTFSLNLLAGASDVDGDTLGVSGLKLQSGQSVRYTLKSGVLSLDTNQFKAMSEGQSQELVFTYTVSDGRGGTVAQTAQVTVEGRNDAPVLAASVALAAIAEDTLSPGGSTVASLFGAKFTDADIGASLAGIAIIGNAATSQGVWQYSTDGGANWADIGAADSTSAVAIAASAKLRFLPAADYFGTPPALQVRGMDNSYGGSWSDSTFGAVRTDASVNGGSTAYAAAITTLSTSVTAVNDAPIASLPVINDAGIGVGRELAFSGETSGTESANTVVALVDGGFLVVSDKWAAAYGDPEFSGILAQRFTADGQKSGTPYLLNANVDGVQSGANLVRLSNGNVLAVWNSTAKVIGNGQGGVSGRLLSADGTPLSAEFKVNTGAAGWTSDYSKPSVAALPSGGFVVSWNSGEGVNGDIYGNGIAAQMFGADGRPMGIEFRVNTTLPWHQSDPNVTVLTDGGFIIVWHNMVNQSYVNLQRFDAQGNKVGDEKAIKQSAALFFGNTIATGLADGGYVIAWTEGDRWSSTQTLTCQRYDGAGNAVGGESRVTTEGDANSPSLTALPDGGYLLSWVSQPAYYDPQASVCAQRYDADGNKVGTAFVVARQIDHAAPNQDVVVLEDGNIVAVWQANSDSVGSMLYMPPLFVENEAAAKVFRGLQLNDVDSSVLKRAVVTITNVAVGDVLSFTPQSGVTGSYNSKTGVLTLSGSATPAVYQAVLESVRFSNTSDAPSTANRAITMTVSDGAAISAPLSQIVQVVAVNDAPKLTISGVVSGLKENAAGLTLAKVAATDPEGDAVTFSVDDNRFEVVGGVLRLKAGASLDYEAVAGGLGTVMVTATDALGAATRRAVGYKIINVDEPLKAADDSVSIVEDRAVTIDILANDLHASNVRLPTITSVSVTHGTVTVNPDGTLTYVPGASRSDPAVITYTLAEDGKTSSAKVSVAITAQADAPVIGFVDATGNTYSTIPLNLTATLADTDGSEALSDITISGLPSEARLSAGTRNVNGDWVLSAAQLPGLSVITSKGGAFNLTVSATSTEQGNGDARTTTVTKLLSITAVPTVNADWLYGKESYDLIYGQPGADYIDGRGGNDEIFGEAGDDVVLGGGGNDYLRGGGGNDILDGGDGDDRLYGDAGVNSVYGGAGNDTLNGYNNTQGLMDGGTGDDLFTGLRGNVTIVGGSGRDTITLDRWSTGGETTRFMDFATGPGGDVIDLSAYVTAFERAGWDGRSNPFTQGFVRLLEVSGGTKVQVNLAGAGNLPNWTTAVVLDKVPAAALTGDNFGQLFNFVPSGGQPAGLVVTSTAGGGNTLSGSGGEDVLINGGGQYYILGGAGNDRITGGTGDEWIAGGAGSDTMYGGEGDDTLYGGYGFDGGIAQDLLFGGAGNDRLALGDGGGTANGGDGNDDIWLYTAAGQTNVADAGSGDDQILLYGSGTNTITTGTGRDVVRFSYTSNFKAAHVVTDFTPGMGGDQIDLTTLLSSLSGWNSAINPFGASGFLRVRQVGTDTLIEVDRDGTGKSYALSPLLLLKNVTISSLNRDNFTPAFDPTGAAPTGQTLTGGYGNDSLFGGAGSDYLAGGDGNDMLSGSAGADLLQGGNGGDNLQAGSGNDVLDGGAGNDWLYGDDGDDWLYGGTGDDTLNGGNGSDRLFGGDGNDKLGSFTSVGVVMDGGVGNDIITIGGYGGTDTVTTGVGRDTVVIQSMTGTVATAIITDFTAGDGGDAIDLNQFQQSYLQGWDGHANPFGTGFLRVVQSGADTLLQVDTDSFGGSGQWRSLAVLAGIDAKVLTAANFFPAYSPDGGGVFGTSLTGGVGADVLPGTYGDDVLNGGSGNDTLTGAAGRDVLSGGDGNDLLDGGMGGDTLIGGAGNDTLAGGAGQDVYMFSRGDGTDTIVNATNNLDAAADTLRFGSGLDSGSLWFAKAGANLEISLMGSADKLVLAGWYDGSVANRVQTLQLADGSTLVQSNVESLISAMAAFAPPPATQSQLTVQQHQALDTVIAANWQHS